MAYLGNTLINGSLRCLNKAYFGDLSVSGTTSFANLDVSGKTTTNQLVVNNSNNPGTLSSTNSNTGNIPVIIGNPNGKHIAIDGDEIAAKNGVTTASDMWLNYGGGAVYLGSGGLTYLRNNVFVAPTLNSTTSTITTGNIATLNASSTTTTNLVVNDTLKSFKWDISNVANLANDFMVAPTIEIATDGKVSVSKSGSDYIFTFADSNTIKSDEFAGCKWLDGSKVRFTTKINDKLFSDVYGTVTGNMNTTSGRLAVKTSLTDDDLTGISMNTPYDAVGSTIMLYAITKTGDTNIYPVGIHMTAYGTNNSYYIDMYGGNSPSSSGIKAQPVFRIGNLKGITYNGQTFQEAKWGVYTYNGYFEGAVVAKEGKIGEWIIDSKKIYTGTWGTANSAMMSPGTTSTDGNKSIGGSDSISGWTFTSGANFGVNKDGSLYANKGKIGNWIIETDRLHIGNIGDTTSVVLSTGVTSTTDIGGSGTRTSENALTWVFTAGNKFGVTNNGVLYANDVNVTGAVNASTLHVGNSSSTNHLIYENNTIDLQTDWLKFDSATSTVTIGKTANVNDYNIVIKSSSSSDTSSSITLRKQDKELLTLSSSQLIMRDSSGSSNPFGYFTVVSGRDNVVYNKAQVEVVVDEAYNSSSRTYTLSEWDGLADTNKFYFTYGLKNSSYSYITSVTCNFVKGTAKSFTNFSTVCAYDGDSTITISSNDSSVTYGGLIYYTYDVSRTSPGYIIGRLLNKYGLGEYSVSTGYNNEVLGQYAFGAGYQNQVYGQGDHVVGTNNYSSGGNCHVEGRGNKATNSCCHAEGTSVKASGAHCHAEGFYTVASGAHCHAEGSYTVASGNYSHSEGGDTVASGYASHAEGEYTVASAGYSHSEGRHTTASGECSHAQGRSTVASGGFSSASGWGTHAANSCQTVIGTYNIVTTSGSGNNITYDAGDYAFIIGNGSVSTTNRSNALTVDWNGRVNSISPNVSTASTPSSDKWIPHYNMADSTGYVYGVLQGDFLSNGVTGVALQTQRMVGSTRYQNAVRLRIESNGTPQVVVDHPEKWRIALGVNIKTYSTTITTNQYGEVTIPSALSSKTILSVRCNNYQYGCFLAGSSIRVFKISATPLAWVVNTAIPFIFIYIQ